MELYTLDSAFRPNEIVDTYSSLIWTERFNSVGEVALEFPMREGLPSFMGPGTWLNHTDSDRVMRIDTIEISRNDDGVEVFKATGLESTDILRYRTAWSNLAALGEDPKWTYRARPHTIMNVMVDRAILGKLGVLTPFTGRDLVPNADITTYVAHPGIIPYPVPTIAVNQSAPVDVLSYIEEIAKAYALGFRLYLKKYDGKIYYETYAGYNRTLEQDTLEPVVFSPKLDNIKDISLLRSVRNYITSMSIYTKNGFRAIHRPGDENIEGFDKRSDRVNIEEAEGLTTTALRNEWLDEKGAEYLALANKIIALDGEITQSNKYVYNDDYFLGDLVDIQSEWGESNRCRVTEQIFTDDDTGFRAYPTLQTEEIVTADSWLGTNPSESWGSPNPDNTWSER